MSAALISLATQVGAPIIKRILSDKIGPRGAELAEDVMTRIAAGAGVAPAGLDDAARDMPEVVGAALVDVETVAPELISLYSKGLEGQYALQQAELRKEHWFAWAWRPGWMVLLGVFWLWNIVILHLLNAILKWALPPTDTTTLLGLTSLFMALYMGGHTVKDVFGKIKGTR